MNKDMNTKGDFVDKDEAHKEFARQAAHKRETEADLAKLDDEHAKVNLKKQETAKKPTSLDALEARVTRLEEAVRMASPSAAAGHLIEKI